MLVTANIKLKLKGSSTTSHVTTSHSHDVTHSSIPHRIFQSSVVIKSITPPFSCYLRISFKFNIHVDLVICERLGQKNMSCIFREKRPKMTINQKMKKGTNFTHIYILVDIVLYGLFICDLAYVGLKSGLFLRNLSLNLQVSLVFF